MDHKLSLTLNLLLGRASIVPEIARSEASTTCVRNSPAKPLITTKLESFLTCSMFDNKKEIHTSNTMLTVAGTYHNPKIAYWVPRLSCWRFQLEAEGCWTLLLIVSKRQNRSMKNLQATRKESPKKHYDAGIRASTPPIVF